MKSSSIEDLFAHEVQVLHNAENEIQQRLPRLAQAAKSPQLREILAAQVTQSKAREPLLQQLLGRLEVPTLRSSCIAISVMLAEGERLLPAGLEPDALDAELALAAQRIKQYQTSGYQATRNYAAALSLKEHAGMFDAALIEDEAASGRLAELTSGLVNAN